jgi:hypothetical protein
MYGKTQGAAKVDVGGDQLVGNGSIPLIPQLLVVAPDDGLVLFDRHNAQYQIAADNYQAFSACKPPPVI